MLLWLIALLWILSELGAPFGIVLCVIIGYIWHCRTGVTPK